jgi:hypothetical protein
MMLVHYLYFVGSLNVLSLHQDYKTMQLIPSHTSCVRSSIMQSQN